MGKEMKKLFETTRIYTSETLQKELYDLESRYTLTDEHDKFHNLVNFSTNTSVPYHQWFPYREGFSGQLINELITLSNANPQECIIDPFCGSGTTNIVAAQLGFDTIGLDVNPMSAFLTDAKVTCYTDKNIDDALTICKSITPINTIIDSADTQDIKKYFTDENYYGLVHTKSIIDSVEDDNVRKLLLVGFLAIVIDCSNRKRDGNGLKIHASKVENVYDYYTQKMFKIIEDIRDYRVKNIKGYGIYDSALNMSSIHKKVLKEKPVGSIIFSPPYANSFDYFESYKLELVFGGFTDGIRGLNELRKKAVRSFIGGSTAASIHPIVDEIANEIEQAIPIKELETGKTDSRTRRVPNMIRGYFYDMDQVIKECAKCLNKDKSVFIVVDQSSYLGKIVPTDLIFGLLGEQEGFYVEKIIECRKARTSTQQLNKYPYLKNCLRESIVQLKKR